MIDPVVSHGMPVSCLPLHRQVAGTTRHPHALLVSPDPDGRVALERLFRQQNWGLSVVDRLSSALEFLRNTAVALVICERDLDPGSWKDLLRGSRDQLQSASLVVISRLADEYLWSEVLNFGGSDVLAKPLCESEALRVFSYAFYRWRGAGSVSGKAVAAC